MSSGTGSPRLLVGSDFHLGPQVANFEGRLSADVLPLFLGDLVNRPREDAEAYQEIVSRWARRNPDLVVVPGNHDPLDTGRWEGVRVARRRDLSILVLPVIPILYKIPTWTHEYSERTIAEMVEPFRGGSFDLVASHGPPRGACDRTAWGRAIGSTALRDFSRTIRFRLWLCGHVHEQGGARDRIDGRPIVNAAKRVLELDLPAGPPQES